MSDSSHPEYVFPTNFTPSLDKDELIKQAVTKCATELYFDRERVFMRAHWELVLVEGWTPEPNEYRDTLLSFLKTQGELAELNGPAGVTDFMLEIGGQRLRGTLAKGQNGLNLRLRLLPVRIFGIEELGISPKLVKVIAENRSGGLVLVTGPSGSGKSTTISALIGNLNQNHSRHIAILEKDGDVVFPKGAGIISQRELPDDPAAFGTAFRQVLRENPDVIVCGDICDYPTLRTLLLAAETGHLVIATVHTKRAATTISRLVELAADEDKAMLRNLLANNLLMTISQRILRRKNGGRIACREILINTGAAANAIRAESASEIENLMVTHRKDGMIDWETALNALVDGGLVDPNEAALYRTK